MASLLPCPSRARGTKKSQQPIVWSSDRKQRKRRVSWRPRSPVWGGYCVHVRLPCTDVGSDSTGPPRKCNRTRDRMPPARLSSLSQPRRLPSLCSVLGVRLGDLSVLLSPSSLDLFSPHNSCLFRLRLASSAHASHSARDSYHGPCATRILRMLLCFCITRGHTPRAYDPHSSHATRALRAQLASSARNSRPAFIAHNSCSPCTARVRFAQLPSSARCCSVLRPVRAPQWI